MAVYATTADLLDRLGIEVGDSREGLLSAAIETASRFIDTQTSRKFTPTTSQTRYYTADNRFAYDGLGDYDTLERPYGSGYHEIHTDDILTVTLLATDEDGDGVYETTWTVGTDYWLGPRNASVKGQPYRSIHRNRAVGRYIFPAWENAIAVTGTFGYSTTVPGEIREACLAVAETMAKPLLDATIAGVKGYKLGNELQVTMEGDSIPEYARRIISNYRNPIFL